MRPLSGLDGPPSDDPIQRGLAALFEAVERHLVGELELSERAVPEEFTVLTGTVRGHAVRLESREFHGGTIARLTVATMLFPETGRLLSCTVSAVPDADTGLPVLGLDYVALRGALSLVALDLSPLDGACWSRDVEPLLTPIHDQAADALEQRPRPPFLEGVFSPRAVFARADATRAALACGMGVRLVGGFSRLARARGTAPSPGGAQAARIAQRRWNTAMRRNKKEVRALTAIFGPVSRRYIDHFLFPEPRPSAPAHRPAEESVS